METFSWAPDVDWDKNVKPQIHEVKFADGYSTRTPVGINNKPREGTFTFSYDSDTVDDIEDFLETAGGVTAFYFTFPRELSARIVTCKSWRRTQLGPEVDRISATFEETFEP